MDAKRFIEKNNGPSGKMYNEKYVKNNYPEIYNEIILFCNEKLNNISFKQKVYHYVHNIKDIVICENPNCDKPVKFKNSTIGYHSHCSIKCISSDPMIKKLKEDKSLKKFGTKSPAMNKEIVKKMLKTNNEKYGHNCPLQNEIIKQKSKKTLMENFGVDNPNKCEEISIKRIKTFSENMREKYMRIYNDIGLIDIDYQKKKMVFNCDKGHTFDIDLGLFHNRRKIKTVLCTVCNPIDAHVSGQEISLQNFIKENYDCDLVLNNRNILKPYELDVYIPKLKIGFEFNGLFYHNEKNLDNNYHFKKTELSEKIGISLIQIYEDDWLYRQDIVKSIILNLLNKTQHRIYARSCEIKEVEDNKLIKNFLEFNHIQGFIGSNIKIGLFYKDELVSLMTFGKLRLSMGQKNTKDHYEMLRFCNKLNTNVIGGASRLFNQFVKKYDPEEVISYADRSWSQGKLYKMLGFNLMKKTKPNYYYIVNKERKYRFLFRKDILIKNGFDASKTEHEIMLERKIYRIYDSGNLKFVYKKKEL